jgi:acyl dehydratase
MTVDPSFVGRRYALAESYLVGREKIREFADAIGADDAAFHDPAAAAALGHPDVIAPPTFPVVVTTLAGQKFLADPALGLDFSRVVHGDQRFAYTRPVRAGDRLNCVCEVEEITSRAGNDFITTRTDVTSETGEPIVSVWSMLVARA